MTVSTISKKVKCFKSVLDYISRGSAQPGLWTRNLLRSGAKDVLKAFRDNARHVRPRKGGIWFYHQWLSFHPDDRDKLSPAKLRTLSDKYLELLLGERFFAVAAPHFDTRNVHVHIMFPANEIKGFRKIHLDDAEFREIRRELERFQRKRFPELSNSIVYLEDRKRELGEPRKTFRESKREKRLEKEEESGRTIGKRKISEKDAVFETVKSCLETAVSEEEFREKLKSAGLEFYRRGKKTFGVQRPDGEGKYKKFRLKTLGLGELYEKSAVYWENRPKMEKEFKRERELKVGRDLSSGLELSLRFSDASA